MELGTPGVGGRGGTALMVIIILPVSIEDLYAHPTQVYPVDILHCLN